MSYALDQIGEKVNEWDRNVAQVEAYKRQLEAERAPLLEEFAEIAAQYQTIVEQLTAAVDSAGIKEKTGPVFDFHRSVNEYTAVSNPINLGRLQVDSSLGRTHGFAEIEIQTLATKRVVEVESRRFFLPRRREAIETTDSGEVNGLRVTLYAGTANAEDLGHVMDIAVEDLTKKQAMVVNREAPYPEQLTEDKGILAKLAPVAEEIDRQIQQPDTAQ